MCGALIWFMDTITLNRCGTDRTEIMLRIACIETDVRVHTAIKATDDFYLGFY